MDHASYFSHENIHDTRIDSMVGSGFDCDSYDCGYPDHIGIRHADRGDKLRREDVFFRVAREAKVSSVARNVTRMGRVRANNYSVLWGMSV